MHVKIDGASGHMDQIRTDGCQEIGRNRLHPGHAVRGLLERHLRAAREADMQQLNATHKDKVALLDPKSLRCRQIGKTILPGRANAQQMLKEVVLEKIHVCVNENVNRQTRCSLLQEC